MGSIRAQAKSKKLFFDFRYRGRRCREYTELADTQANRRKLSKALARIEGEIQAGTFVYATYFPNSKMLEKLGDDSTKTSIPERPLSQPVVELAPQSVELSSTPDFEEFADLWLGENEVAWRRTYRRTVSGIVNRHLKPAFAGKEVSHITKAEIMAFRSTLAKVPGRKADTLSPKRINAVIGVLRQILDEAADRFDFTTPYRNIKPLRVPRTHVEPFSLDEVRRILSAVRPDYRAYYTVRFFTGLRTGEIDGLKWQYIDFERRAILIRETRVGGEEEYTKTDGSQREIQMSQVVYDALRAQEAVSSKHSTFVFCNRRGEPLDHNNVTKRVWYPLLRHLGITLRRPYQTRHTAATLWLASGENPEWIARQLGHSSTQMLFSVYARYVPNLTRRDGSAFEQLLAAKLDT